MNSWFDIYSLDSKTMASPSEVWSKYSQKDINQSADLLLSLLEEERNKFADKDASRVFIGGFSQGCMVSLAAFLKYKGDKPFGGLIGLSGMQALEFKPEEVTPEVLAVQK